MSKARSSALNAVLFACRMKILAERLQHDHEDPELQTGLLQPGGANEPADGGAVLARLSVRTPGRPPTPGTPAFNRISTKLQEAERITQAADDLIKNPVTSDLKALRELVLSHSVNVLLVCVPLGMYAAWSGWGAVPVFALNFLALIPLAMTLGDITEDLALRMGPVVGGLLNATFGNVTEVVLSLAALQKGLFDVVADSLLGSILSNLLLVLGCCFLVGGSLFKTQSFNTTSNKACSTLLFLSCIGIAMPTAAAGMITDTSARAGWVLDISRGTAVVLLLCYVLYLVFTLYTHADLFEEEEEEGGEPEVPVLTVAGAICALSLLSVLIAVHSEFLTGAIEETSSSTGISTGFLAMIVLPIAGNACEHLTAVLVAAKNKMDLSLGIAIGSSLQIALFAIPLCVIVGWFIGQPMSLDYDFFSVTALVLSVIHANLVTADGSSHWLMGVQLCAVYVLIALVFWFR